MSPIRRMRPELETLERRDVPSLLATALHRPITVGTLGDSYTDEYRFYPPDRSQARNWVEILAATRGVDFGPFTTHSRGEPRDQGFAFDWARSAATSADMVRGQLPGLAAQVARGQVQYASIFTGGNDFLFFLGEAATGQVKPQDALSAVARVAHHAEADVRIAVQTLLAASPRVKVVVATLPDVTQLPIVRGAIPDSPTARSILTAVRAEVGRFNAAVRAVAGRSPRVVVADLAALTAGIERQAGRRGVLPFGGTIMDVTEPGDGFRHFYLADGLHAGTVGQGLMADVFVHAIDRAFGAAVAPLSPREITQFARHVPPDLP